MGEITYRATWREWKVGLHIGISNMTPVSRGMWFGLGVLFFAYEIMVDWLLRYHLTWPLSPLPPLPSLLDVVFKLIGMLIGAMIVALIVPWVFLTRTAQLTPNALVIRFWGRPRPIPWISVTTILDTGEHLCFCRDLPSAIVIPKEEFTRKKDAEAFLAQATKYWQLATGRVLPASATGPGIWPPAPRPADSVEPGDEAEC